MVGICLAAVSVLIAYPIVAGWAAKSETPRWFGRYSTFLLLFNVVGTLLLGCSLWAWRRSRPEGVLFFAALLSVLPFGNNSLGGLPGLVFTMWLLRLLSAFGMAVRAFDVSRRGGRASLILTIGTTLLALTAADFVLFGVARLRVGQTAGVQAYRYPYDLSQIANRDLVLVGDSFVWGQGVSEGQEFGALMQADSRAVGKVFSLGQIGTGPAQYLKSISDIPLPCRSRRVIVCYYHNDMPAPEQWDHRIQSLGSSVGRGVPTLRFVGDMLAKKLTPTPHDYLRQLVENYSPTHRSHAERWALLRHQLEQCFAAAQPRSIERPGLLILPGLIDFQAYPFAAAHRDVGILAAGIGFEVFDSLVAFQEAGILAGELWASPGDPHFNDRGHKITAEFLSGCLRQRTESLK